MRTVRCKYNASGGGLVTALLGLTQNIGVTWVASAINDVEKKWQAGKFIT
jgi:hypothetical protein